MNWGDKHSWFQFRWQPLSSKRMRLPAAIFFTSMFLFSCVSSLGLDGVQLKMATLHSPPYHILTRGPEGNYTVSGASINFGKWLAKKLNFTLSLVVVTEEDVIAKGTVNTIFDKIFKKEVDGAFAGFTVTPDRKERMDFTPAFWIEPYTLLVPVAVGESRLFSFIRPFQPTVWICIFATLLMVVGLMSWFSWVYTRRRLTNATENQNSSNDHHSQEIFEKVTNLLGLYTVHVVNIITNHGICTPFVHNSFRILFGCLLLAAVVLVNSYSSIVVSSMTVPRMKPTVNSFEDLAASHELSLVLRKDHIIGLQILNATSGAFKILGDQARQSPDRMIVNDPVTLLRKLESGRYSSPTLRSFTRFFVANQFKKEKQCRFQSSDPLPVSPQQLSILLQKNSIYTPAFTYGILQLWETGFPKFWIDNIIPSGASQCLDKRKNYSVYQTIIKLEDLTSAFFILGLGMGLATLSFVTEIIISMRLLTKKRSAARRQESTTPSFSSPPAPTSFRHIAPGLTLNVVAATVAVLPIELTCNQ